MTSLTNTLASKIKFACLIFGRFRQRALLVVVGVLLLQSMSALVSAQQWHISNPPVEQSVPQYRSSYPLHDEPDQSELPPAKALEELPTPLPKVVPDNLPTLNAPVPVQKLLPPLPMAPQHLPPRASAPPAANPQPTNRGSQVENPPANLPQTKLAHPSFGLDFSEYRNRETFPADPRQPCNVCTRPAAVLADSYHNNWPGYRGMPHREEEPGGCRCGKKDAPKQDQMSVYWSRPFSAIKNDDELRDLDPATGQPCPKKRLSDRLDSLATFKLIDYQRSDNGYCGRGADPYGCLGESQHR